MSVGTTVSTVFHQVFAALWAGSVVFVTYAVVPAAGDGQLNAAPLGTLAGRLKWISRASAVVLLLTGGHLALTEYGLDGLLQGSGHLVLAMIGLWVVLMGLVEVGAAKLTDGAANKKVRAPARNARRFLQAASVVAILLLVDAGLLAAGGF
jgi:uncharacterized membrane protein